ncbi:amino acid permease-domain-containing protein [Bombardia bombarda]|uniref:Amino acid permease-domain-containing protein n=1 Tax=Bombardia bombarda TaxID=252184 RepID=A0AA39XMF1_9PEZI|nr:amino acid permease-domain-containing protein [Bombardia bombarda]
MAMADDIALDQYPRQRQNFSQKQSYDHSQGNDQTQENHGNSTDTIAQWSGGPVPVRPHAPETELRRSLKERHINMIGFSMVLGVGLFLSSGKVVSIAGPGGAILAYLVMGTLMWSTMASLGEMTALFPVKGPTFEFSRRFIDESVGYASAWLLWFSYCIVSASEILAITEIFRFKFEPEYLEQAGYPNGTTIEWASTLNVNPAVWVVIFLIVIGLFNLLPVLWYGRIEYIFGCIKISFIVALIMINTVLNARQRFHSDRFWAYQDPYGFSNSNFTVKTTNPDSGDGIVYTGDLGRFTAFWTAMVTSFFSLMGWDSILLTAPENRDLEHEETIKISSRKIALRVIILYTLAVLTVGLNVGYTDPNLGHLTINGITGGQNSIYVLAAVHEHVPFLPHFLNGFFVFSACTTSINCLYSASRILHAIATLRDAWPRWGWTESIRSRLEQTRLGVPMTAVFASWLLVFLAFLSTRSNSSDDTTKSEASEVLGRMTMVASTSTLIVYATNCLTFLLFFRETRMVAAGEKDEALNITPEIRCQYDRNYQQQYPYRSHLQWLRAGYALVFCILMILFQGWRTFVPPFSSADFVASYISIVIFFTLSAAYFLRTRGFNPRNWHRLAQKLHGLDAIGPIVAVDPQPCQFCGQRHRRGRLSFPDGDGNHKQKAKAVLEWIWVWLK